MDCIRDCVRRVGKFTKLCHYMLVLDERSLYFSLTPEDDLGLVKSLKVGRSVPDLVYDVGIDIQSYVPSPASPIERIGVPRWPRRTVAPLKRPKTSQAMQTRAPQNYTIVEIKRFSWKDIERVRY